jgi:hypothetical protein
MVPSNVRALVAVARVFACGMADGSGMMAKERRYPMEIKNVNITDSVSVPVPLGLTPDEEATYIANRIAFVNFEELEAQCTEALQLLDEGKLVSLQSVLDEIKSELKTEDGQQP